MADGQEQKAPFSGTEAPVSAAPSDITVRPPDETAPTDSDGPEPKKSYEFNEQTNYVTIRKIIAVRALLPGKKRRENGSNGLTPHSSVRSS